LTIAQLFQRQQQLTTEEYERRFRQEILPAYRQSFREIDNNLKDTYAKVLATKGTEDYYNEMLKYGRYRSLMASTEQAFNESARRAGLTIRASSEASFANSFYFRQFGYDLVIPQGLRTISILPQALIDLSVLGTPEVWEEITAKDRQRIIEIYGSVDNYQPQYGTLQSVLLADRTRQLNSIKNVITQAFIQGQSYTRASKNLRSVFDTTASNAMRIVRTEGNRLANAGNWAASQSAKAQGIDIVRQWDATLDGKTREDHARLDGQREDENGFFTIDGNRTRYPGHFGVARQDVNCRCGIIDIVDNISPQVRTARDKDGNNVTISFASFDQWAKDNDLHYVNGILKPKT
jgi:SPP1 gp7 family putative phage head morphogenesis protein